MSDEEQSVRSSTYSSDGEEEDPELDEYGEAEPEAEGEGDGEDGDQDAEPDGEGDAEGEGDPEAVDGEGEGEESDDDDEDASTESSEEEEEEELDVDDAEGDDDLEDDGGDLEAALENMEAMDDEPPDDEAVRAPSEVPVPAEKQATATQLRRKLFFTQQPYPRSYAIDPICALPHPVPTSCLASSVCMTYLTTGSEDGFVRCYDFFAGINGKTFLTAPQRHHCGIGEGTMKAGVLKMWWENYAPTGLGNGGPAKNEDGEDKTLSPVHSMAMQGDALWSLSGTSTGHVNLTTIRHEPGRSHHTFSAHNKGPVSCLALTPDEQGFFSAGWDGDTKQWDLNTGQMVRIFGGTQQQRDNSSQVVSLGLRPQVPISQAGPNEMPNADLFSIGFDGGILPPNGQDPNEDRDSHSSSSDNSLFGDDDDDDSGDEDNSPKQPKPRRKATGRSDRPNGTSSGGSAVAQSPDLMMTAYIDGQVLIWDRRAPPQSKPLRLEMGEKSPPWCVSACWSANGHEVYAGRRIGTIDVWDIRQSGGYSNATGQPRLLKSLRNPASSGPVTCVVGFPDGHHLVCASQDNIRLWKVSDESLSDHRRGVPFKIIAGHHGGVISHILVDASSRFMITASGNRGWFWLGESTRTVLVHDLTPIF
ncbi:Transcription factor spt8 [Tulasnella sp. JGI-2019a]|nr:Transcription factor spt8 [Tulasnella sp. JGI-2019a]